MATSHLFGPVLMGVLIASVAGVKRL